MRHLLSSEYIPFGTQYYRAPSPHRGEWETDLRNIARLGLNTVKFWVQWRWNNPIEDEYNFDDIDRLMELAEENHLRVMLNTIFDVAPGWLYRKYPDAVMITRDGRKIGPQTQPHRQIGGLGLCFNHDEAMEYFYEFLETTIKRYNNHPALEIWNIGSEPELTSSMAEMRLYADDASKMGDMLCYCDNCKKAFRRWLRDKYGTIDRLNVSWNRNYHDFADTEIPLTRNTFNDIIDWRMFFVHTLGENVRRRFEVARANNPGTHPLMCHHVFIQGFPITSTASDPWNVGRYGDLHGFTQMDDPMMADVLRSCAKGKPVISAEMLMLYGYTLEMPKPIVANDVKRYVFTGVAANLKGFIFWQYRPEILGREAPTWGLSFLDGSETPWLKSFAEVNEVIQRNASFLLDAAPPKAEVAILYHPENQIFAWASTGSEKTATDSLLGTHKALYERNIVIDFLHPMELGQDVLDNYKVLYVPFPYHLGEEVCRKIASWVARGGVLIGESYFGGWNVENGHHNMIVPGYGLHRVFQARQTVVGPADEQGTVGIKTEIDLPLLKKGSTLSGMLVKETLAPEGASIIARFAGGEPAATVAAYGNGKAILIGSYLGLPYQRNGFEGNGKFLASLAAEYGKISKPEVQSGSKIRIDILMTPQGKTMLIVRNLEDAMKRETISVPAKLPPSLIEQFSGETLPVNVGECESSIEIALNPHEVRVWCG